MKLPAARRRKYGNTPCVVDGQRFDSIAEANRYQALRLLERAGTITDLQRQVKIPLHVTGVGGEQVLIGHYVADAAYYQDGQFVLEDVKGAARTTDVFRWKAKHVAAQYGIEIVQIRRGRARHKPRSGAARV